MNKFLLFFVFSVIYLVFFYSTKEQEDFIDDIIFLDTTQEIKETFNEMTNEISIAMTVYKNLIESKKIKLTNEKLEEFKKDNEQIIKKSNEHIKNCLASKNREEFIINVNFLTKEAMEYELKYNVIDENNTIANKYNLYKNCLANF